MFDLVRFFRNPFNDRRITLNQLVVFASMQLEHMVGSDVEAVLSERISATSAALVALQKTKAGNATKLALRKARVKVKETFRSALPRHLVRIHGALVAAFGPDSAQVLECFPQGRSAFTTCTDQELDEQLLALKTGITPLAAQVGQAQVDAVAELVSSWSALIQQVISNSTRKRGVELARREARQALQRELFRNVLALAQHFLEDEEMARLYCPQYLLEHPRRAKETAETSAA